MIGFLNKETRYKRDNIFGSGRLPSSEEFIMKMAETVAKQKMLA